MNIFIIIAGFTIVALASRQIGQYFTRAKLPLISGFLFTGIIAGPFMLGLITEEAIKTLRFIDQLSLAFIALAAGSELYLKDLRSRLKSIKWMTIGLVATTFILGSLTVFVLADFISFMQNMPISSKIAVSILAGTIMAARSPSSAIAIVNELRAKGPFTQTILGVTMVTDVVVIMLFSVNASIADSLLTSLRFNINLIILVVAELLVSLAIGCVLGKILKSVLSWRINSIVKTGMILLAGYGIFLLSEEIRSISRAQLPFEILLEPLLICMIGGFLVANHGNCRDEFRKILYDIGPVVYIIFFTLTGASLELDILSVTWPIALALFFVRIAGIFIGSSIGGMLSGDPVKHNKISWMAYLTQAGIGLGLAKQVASEFPEWGSDFATVIISVIVLNQIVGPIFFKWAINMAGEARSHLKMTEFDGTRNVIIFGLERQSIALARTLCSRGWLAKIATVKSDSMEKPASSDINIYPIAGLTIDAFHRLDAKKAGAIVSLLSDEENYRICEIACEHFGTKNLVVRLNDRANFDRFHEIGTLIVEPGSALVSLLDNFVRSPSGASLLLGMEKNQDIVDLEVRNPDLHGIPLRELRLPLDTLILSVRRDDLTLISHGYTQFEIGDWATVIGSTKSLEEVMLLFDA